MSKLFTWGNIAILTVLLAGVLAEAHQGWIALSFFCVAIGSAVAALLHFAKEN